MDDPVTGASGALMRGEETDPKLIETNTATEYWQKGASLLHTDPLGTAGCRTAGECADLPAAGNAARRQGGDAARQRAMPQSTQLA